MKSLLPYSSLLLLLVGAAALILVPVLWNPEPVLAFRVGIGAAIFVVCLVITLILLAAILADNWRSRKTNRQLADSRQDYEEGHHQFIRRLDHEIKNPLTGLQAALVNLREASRVAVWGYRSSGASCCYTVGSRHCAASRMRRMARCFRCACRPQAR